VDLSNYFCIITPKGVHLLTMGTINDLLIINFNLRVGN
jgi:hypothetical protein